MENKKWYCICIDREGRCHRSLADTYAFAYGEEELKSTIWKLAEKFELQGDEVSIFELSKKKVKVDWEWWSDNDSGFGFLDGIEIKDITINE